MPRYAVLLRGINLGGKRKLAMADLRALLAELDYADVRTHLNSGNAVFTSPRTEPAELEKRIEHGIEAELGMTVACLVRTAEQLRATVADNPLDDAATDGSKLMAHFLSARPDPGALAAYDPAELDPEHVRVGDAVVYQWCPNGLREAPAVGSFAERHLGVTVTTRNWNTVTRLALMLEG